MMKEVILHTIYSLKQCRTITFFIFFLFFYKQTCTHNIKLFIHDKFCKKSVANRLSFLYLQLRPGQSSIREINLVSKIILCPFVILLALQKITFVNSEVWTITNHTDVECLFADGYLLRQALWRQITTVQCMESQTKRELAW